MQPHLEAYLEAHGRSLQLSNNMRTCHPLPPDQGSHTSPSCTKRKCLWEGDGEGSCKTSKRSCTAAAATTFQSDEGRENYLPNKFDTKPQCAEIVSEVNSQKLRSRTRSAPHQGSRRCSEISGSKIHFKIRKGTFGSERPRLHTQNSTSSSFRDKINSKQEQDDIASNDAQVNERYPEKCRKGTVDLSEEQTFETSGGQVGHFENESGPVDPPLLSDEDSQCVQEIYEAVMASTTSNKALKRRASGYSFTQTESESGVYVLGVGSERSQQSRITEANYRYKNLSAHKIYVHVEPPQHIKAAICAILYQEIPEDNFEKLNKVAQDMHESCVGLVRASVGEYDFVHLFLHAIVAMGISELCVLEKAEWKEELKPIAKRSGWTFKPFRGSNDLGIGGEKRSNWPATKFQQSSGPAYASPETSMSSVTANLLKQSEPTMAPPALPKKSVDNLLLRNPRSDITVGLKMPSLTSALSSALSLANSPKGFSVTETESIIADIQDTFVKSSNGPGEEAGITMVPTQRSSNLVYPFCIIEGKAYSTGKQIFEAQNQAAVAGACSLRMQRRLDDFVTQMTGEQASKEKIPLFFSVCTEGPYHELWAHYMYIEDGVDKFGQVLLEVCNLMLLKSVVNFVSLVERVMRWGVGSFLDSLVERLSQVVQKGLD